MSRRRGLTALLALLLAVVLVVRPPAGEADGDRPANASALRSGESRYVAFVRAETASLRAGRSAGDEAAERIHLGRLVPARRARSTEPVTVVRAATAMLSLDARAVGRTGLLDLENHVHGAGLALDAVRDALWATDETMVGAVDERLAHVREEIDRHRVGEGFPSAGALEPADRRRLAAALDALAWRLTLAADRVERSKGQD
jgi:hypothetical protein